MRRPCLLGLFALLATYGATASLAAEPLDSKLAKEEGKVLWYDVRQLTTEGRGWPEKELKSPFDRLPAKAEGKVRAAVWGLSRDSAGLCVRFQSDSPELRCRWALTKDNLALPHMAATGVSGVDLYAQTEHGWHWVATGKPTKQTNETALVSGLPKANRQYLLYLPLYNGVTSVEISTTKDSTIAPLPREEKRAKPIVFWGTSITQGGCASRPGMVHTAILGRRLNLPVVNLGFSGNGKMEPEVAELIGEIDAAAYVMDCLPNCTAAEVTERTGPLVTILRKAHPDTPIVLVEDRTYPSAFLLASMRNRNETSRAALKAEFERLLGAGVKNLHYVLGETLLGADGDDTVDGSHPTDLGFVHQADAMEKVLAPLLR